MGVIVGSAVDAFQALFAELYIPLLSAQESWGQAPKHVVQNFLQACTLARKFGLRVWYSALVHFCCTLLIWEVTELTSCLSLRPFTTITSALGAAGVIQNF